MSIFGLDYAWSHPSVSAMRSADVTFVCRYLSNDASKNLNLGEAEMLSEAGIWIVVVWETTANRALSGQSGGAADAREAARQARACGMPDGRPIYFAVDWDASAGQQDEINAYLDGAASVIGRSRVGMYAGYGPIKRAFDAKKITFGWQTYAWSGGRWDSRAQLRQYRNGVRVGGADCDYNRAVDADYGQWRVGAVGGDDMPLTDDDVQRIAEAVWHKALPAAPGASKPIGAANLLREGYGRALEIKALVNRLAQQTPDIDEAEIARLVLAGLPASEIAAAIPNDIAEQVVDEIQSRLAA